MPTFILIAVLFIIAALAAGCQKATSTPPANGGSNTTASNTTPKTDEPKPVDAKPVAPVSETEITGSLANPTEAYKTAYELRKKKDIEGLKKVMSKDIKEFLTMMGEAEKKTLDDVLRDMVEKPQAEKAEARNEKIKGDRATVEYLAETGKWKTMDFEKVDGKWLLTLPKADKEDLGETKE
jgi:hypothetical protein